MTSDERAAMQRNIALALRVDKDFDVAQQIERRVDFLVDYLVSSGRRAYVLGISGGVDSLLAGCLAQRAVERARDEGHEAKFIAMRLPYGRQHDEAAAQKALAVIQPDRTLTVDIKPAADAMMQALLQGQHQFRDAAQQDFQLGNIKARQRMIAQYAVAGTHEGLVIGTDQAAEALMGFFTKHGDGAADVTPLNGLTKRRVRELARALGAPEELAMKVPTADLESLAPMRPDEEAFGVTYEEVDDFLECRPVANAAFDMIASIYRNTAHKRSVPVSPL